MPVLVFPEMEVRSRERNRYGNTYVWVVKDMYYGYYDEEDVYLTNCLGDDEVTHWRYLPEPPNV